MIDISYLFDGTISSAGIPTGAAITTTRNSTNVLDIIGSNSTGNTSSGLGVGVDLGAMDALELKIDIPTTFTAAGAATLTVDFQCSQSAGSGFKSLLLSNVYPVAQLIAGSPLFRYRWPLNQLLNASAGVLGAPGRYYQFVYTVATGPFTAGSVFAYVAAAGDRRQFYAYPNNYIAAAPAGEI
jgi:hypothetical protein